MADDPLAIRGGSTTIPFVMVAEYNLVDTSADEDVASYSIGKNATIIERDGLASNWTRRTVGSRVANNVSIETFSSTGPLFDKAGTNADWCVPHPGGGAAVGDRCYFGPGYGATLAMPIAVNDWLRVNFECANDEYISRGYMLTTGVQTSTSAESGAATQLSAVTAGNKLVGVAFVSSFSGTDLTVKIQVDDVEGFTTPTDAITFSQFTAVGTDHGERTAAETETWYRVDLTGTYTSVDVLVAVGIEPV